MSDDGSKKEGDEKPRRISIPDNIAADLDALLKGAASGKAKFDDFLASSTKAIEKLVDEAKKASAEIDGSKASAATSRVAIDQIQASVGQVAENAKTRGAEVNNLKTEIATAKGAIEEIRKTATADIGVITQSKTDIESVKSAATVLSEKVNREYQNISAAIEELKERQSALTDALKEVAEVRAAADAERSSVTEYIAEISKTKTGFVTLNAESETQYNSLVQKQADIQPKIEEIERANVEIRELRKLLLEGAGDTKSVRDQIAELHVKIASVLTEVSGNRDTALEGFESFKAKTTADSDQVATALNQRFDALHQTLEQKILALLPTAGAAGLAWTYYDAKSRYAPTPVAGSPGASLPQGRSNWIHRFFGYNPLSWGATTFFYVLFMAPLGLLAWGTYDLIWQIEHAKVSLPGVGIIALRFLVAVPLATISTFGFISLQLYRKLYEQYNHKQRIMELYVSFKREIEANGDDEQKKKLLTIMLDSVAEKAWKDGDHVAEADRITDALGSVDKFATLVARWKSITG